jgi:hypothetical protein
MNINSHNDQDSAFSDNISIELPEVKRGNNTTVSYNGLLTNSGAEKVFLHYGYDGWKNAETIPMKRDIRGAFNTEIKVKDGTELNFCFKDNADNWDNNSGINWKVEINS